MEIEMKGTRDLVSGQFRLETGSELFPRRRFAALQNDGRVDEFATFRVGQPNYDCRSAHTGPEQRREECRI